MAQIQTLALALFLVAVEELMPAHLPELLQHEWLNGWRVTLNLSRWQQDGLYSPRTPAGQM